MCRLFAQLSPKPQSAKDFLVDSKFSLLKQSNFNPRNLQKDGWGIGHFGNKSQAVVSKNPKPAFEQMEEFKRTADDAVSTSVLGHLRAASNPRGVPKEQLINLANTQPYTDGRWIFVHNGTLEIPDEAAAELGPLKKEVKSLNDSEVYFWQFIKFLRQHGDVGRAFEDCVRENWRLWENCKGRHKDKQTPYTSLNAIVSDGKQLFAFCHAARAGLGSCGIFSPDQPWQVMSFSQRDGRLIVASENLDEGSWTRFESPELLSAEILREETLRIKRTRYQFENRQLKRKNEEEVPAR